MTSSVFNLQRNALERGLETLANCLGSTCFTTAAYRTEGGIGEPKFTEARWPSGTRHHRLRSLHCAARSVASGSRRRGSPLSTTAFSMGEEAHTPSLKHFSGVKVRPPSCGCQEANTTYCYFTIQNPNHTSNYHDRSGLSCPPNILDSPTAFPDSSPARLTIQRLLMVQQCGLLWILRKSGPDPCGAQFRPNF